jgi:hypothetical protein
MGVTYVHLLWLQLPKEGVGEWLSFHAIMHHRRSLYVPIRSTGHRGRAAWRERAGRLIGFGLLGPINKRMSSLISGVAAQISWLGHYTAIQSTKK